MPFEPVFKSNNAFQPVLRPRPSVQPVTINTAPLEFLKHKLFATADVAQQATSPVSTLSSTIRGNPQEQGAIENILRGVGSIAAMIPAGGVPIMTEQAVKSGIETGNPLKPATDMLEMPFQAVKRQVTGEAQGMTRGQAWQQQPVEEALSILAPIFAAKGIKSGIANRGGNSRVPEIIRKAVEPEVVSEAVQKPVISETPIQETPKVPEIIRQAVEPSTPPVEKVQMPKASAGDLSQPTISEKILEIGRDIPKSELDKLPQDLSTTGSGAKKNVAESTIRRDIEFLKPKETPFGTVWGETRGKDAIYERNRNFVAKNDIPEANISKGDMVSISQGSQDKFHFTISLPKNRFYTNKDGFLIKRHYKDADFIKNNFESLSPSRAGKISPEPTATPDAAVRPAQSTKPVATAKAKEPWEMTKAEWINDGNIIYHGSSDPDIKEFSTGKGKTADFLYATPDAETAKFYGSEKDGGRVYAIKHSIREDKIADLDDPATFEKLANEAIHDISTERANEKNLKGFLKQLYDEGYGKDKNVTKYFDDHTNHNDIPIDKYLSDEGWSLDEFIDFELGNDNIGFSTLDEMVAELPQQYEKLKRAYAERFPAIQPEVEAAREAYGSQEFYMKYQNDFMDAADKLGYEGVRLADPSSTGEATSFVVLPGGANKIHTHESIIERALKQGKPVPPEVLADYPDLAAKYGKPTTAEAVVKKAGEIETPLSGAKEIKSELNTTKIDHKQFKSEINDRLDKMIADAPSLEELSGYKSVDKVGRTGGSDYSTNLDNARDLTEFGINRVEIEIPGDGTFRIWNTREHLERLKALANRPKLPGEDEALRKFAPYNQGLSDKLARNAAKNAKREPKPIDANSIELGALGTPSALNEFMTGTSPLNKAWEGVVDKGKAAIGKFIPERLKQKLSYDSGRPEAWEAAKLAKDQNIASGIEETLGLAKAGKEQFTPDTHGKAYDYLDPTERMTAKPTDLTPEQSASLDRMRETQTKLTNEQVDLGLLDKDVAEANASTYLRRFYDKHEKFDAFLASTFRKFRIKGTGKRYLETPEQRMEAGIKRDPFYAFAKSTAAQRHDIEVGKLFAKVAESPEFSEFVGDKPRAGFATKPIPNTWRYGKLRNKYVTQSIYDDIMEIARPWETSEMSQIYGKLLGVWKAGKTAWNPATHGRNIFSSAIQNDVIAGLSPSRVDKYVNAIQGMIKGEPELKQFRELGGYEGTFNAAELQDFLGTVKAKRGSMMNRSLDYVLEHKMTSPLRAMSKAYQAEEIAFRYAAYKHRLSLGDAPAMAMKIAKQAIPDYAQVPDLIRKARRSPIGAPFISYAYKMLPAITESAIKHPLRAGKYIALTYAMNEFAKSQMGITDEQYNQLRKSKNFDGGSQILLPFTDKAGDPVVMDLTYNLPWGDMLEWGSAAGGTFGQSEGGTGLLDKGLSMLNPIAKSAIEIGGNRNTYTGRDLTTKSMSNVDKGKAIGGQLLNTFAPTFPSRGIPNIIKAAVGEKDYYGKERDLPTTLAKNLVGISVSPINQQAEMQGRTMEFKKTLEDYQRRIYNAARKNDKAEVDRLVREYSDYARQFSN